jgi:N utilization substance protein A
LSLAIGKKGQNVRLAAKLLSWRIDIKSEEEKRQEVESRMAELVVPGAPVTVLLDHGLTEAIAEGLMAAGVPTVEKLGAMTPEQLEAIAGMEAEVDRIQQAVLSYYGQFETEGQAPIDADPAVDAAPDVAPEDAPEDALEDALEELAAEAEAEAEADEPPEGVSSLPLPEDSEKQSVTIESGEPSRSGGD